MGFFFNFVSVVEQLRHEADYSPPSSAEMKNEWIFTTKHTKTPTMRGVYSQIQLKNILQLHVYLNYFSSFFIPVAPIQHSASV
jgi:hypothetical protein